MARGFVFGYMCSVDALQFLMLIFSMGFLIWYVKYRISRKRIYQLADKLPKMPNKLPLVGHGHIFFKSNTQELFNFLNDVATLSIKNNGIATFWIGPLLFSVLTKPEDIEIILNGCMHKGDSYEYMKPFLGDGLLTGTYNVWKTHRKLMTPKFGQKILDGYIEVFNNYSYKMSTLLKIKDGKEKFDIYKYMASCTLDAICATTMGAEVNAQENPDAPYIKASKFVMDVGFQKMFKIWMQIDCIFNKTKMGQEALKAVEDLKYFTKQIIIKKKADYNASRHNTDDIYTDQEHKRMSLLDHMIVLSEEGGNWSDEELQNEADTIVVTGSDTTAGTASFVLVMLGAHPHMQDNVVEELREIFGSSMRPVEKEDLPRMQYLERVIKETLRLYPVAPIIVRKTEKEYTLGERVIPANTSCMINIFILQRRKDIWGPDADEFNPDRFVGNCQSIPPCAYMPFSSGPRNCIGKQYAMMSMKIIISTILRSYKIEAATDTVQKMTLKTEIVLKPTDGHQISIQKRKWEY